MRFHLKDLETASLIDDKGFLSGKFEFAAQQTPIEKQSMIPRALIGRKEHTAEQT